MSKPRAKTPPPNARASEILSRYRETKLSSKPKDTSIHPYDTEASIVEGTYIDQSSDSQPRSIASNIDPNDIPIGRGIHTNMADIVGDEKSGWFSRIFRRSSTARISPAPDETRSEPVFLPPKRGGKTKNYKKSKLKTQKSNRKKTYEKNIKKQSKKV